MRDEIEINFLDKQKLHHLRLIRSPQVGPVTFQQLIARFGTAEAALEALPEMIGQGGGKAPKVCSEAAAAKEMARYRKAGAKVIFWGETAYPPRLAVLVDAPPVLSVIGNMELLLKKSVAVVGARNASSNGKTFAEGLARDIGAGGYLVVSGMARGIDAAAHRGALQTGTVAVLGGGVDVVYPRQNADLYARLRDEGALISEIAPGTQPTARHFPRRNRIISGMARGVVVVEASPRSGSLITARLAADQGREVFAVPGAALDPRARGTNGLIRDGAVLTETADDVLSALDTLSPSLEPSTKHDAMSTPKIELHNDDRPNKTRAFEASLPLADAEVPSGNLRTDVIASLGHAPTATDTVVRQLGAPASTITTILLELELAGRLERHPGNLVSLKLDG